MAETPDAIAKKEAKLLSILSSDILELAPDFKCTDDLFDAGLDCWQNLSIHQKSLQSASMKPTSSETAQTSFLHPDLEKQLDPRSLLYRLA